MGGAKFVRMLRTGTIAKTKHMVFSGGMAWSHLAIRGGEWASRTTSKYLVGMIVSCS